MWRTLLIPLVWTACILSPVFAFRAASGQDGLLGHWKFDEGYGDVAVDSSGRENDGDIWGAQWVKGEFGTALHFDGTGSHVSIPEIVGLDGSDELTVQAWVYWEGTGRYPNIISGGTWSPGGFLMFVRDDQCTFRMGRPGTSASTDRQAWREISAPLVTRFALRRWYHLAAAFKRPVIKTYVDGQQVGSANWDYPVAYNNDLVIGKWGGAESHEGLIDDVKIFNRALDAEQIAADYRQQAAARVATPDGEEGYERIPRTSGLDAAIAKFDTQHATLAISPQGRCTALLDRRTGEDQILRTTPLVSINQGGKIYTRSACSYEDGKLIFRFAKAQTTVVVRITAKPQYFVFGIESVDTTKGSGRVYGANPQKTTLPH